MAQAIFTPDMKKTHTILIPDMLPLHFGFISEILRQHGYKTVLLKNSSRSVVDEGLENVHNDACYPALLVIGQFMDALKSGEYDPDKTALMISQTGGGCRASNYIHLLRKALSKDYPQVPVISLNFSGLENGGFKITLRMLVQMMYAVLYGDLIMMLYNQCRPYEINSGDSDRVKKLWQKRITKAILDGSCRHTKKLYRKILDSFSEIKRSGKRIKVGIVGEIYVKYSPLANNDLENYLISEKCEPVVPAFMDFCMYCTVNQINDRRIYGKKSFSSAVSSAAYRLLYSKQREMIKIISEHGQFQPPHDFEELRRNADKFLSQGVKMGEGWLIPAEMAALAQHGTENIICTQPFGCLPNHIVARGSARVIREAFPNVNITAVDYDPGASRVNQENRIKLMLSGAKPAGE